MNIDSDEKEFFFGDAFRLLEDIKKGNDMLQIVHESRVMNPQIAEALYKNIEAKQSVYIERFKALKLP